MKRRLCQPALTEVEVSFAGEESFAQQSLRANQRAAFHEILLIGYQDIPNQVGMVEKMDSLVTYFEENYVAVFLR